MKFYGRPQAVTVTVSVPKVELLLALLEAKLIPEPEKACKLDTALNIAFSHFSPADLKLVCEDHRLGILPIAEFTQVQAIEGQREAVLEMARVSYGELAASEPHPVEARDSSSVLEGNKTPGPGMVVDSTGATHIRTYRTWNPTTGISTEWGWDAAKDEHVAVREFTPPLRDLTPEEQLKYGMDAKANPISEGPASTSDAVNSKLTAN